MGKSKKEKEFKEVEEIIGRFKHLSTEELIDRRSLFSWHVKSSFKIAINKILQSRGVNKSD